MKRFILIGMLLSAAWVFVCGCKESGSAKTLEVWSVQPGSVQIDRDGSGIFTRAIEHFNRVYPDITVNLVIMEDDAYRQKLAEAAVLDQMPDLFFTWTGSSVCEYASNNQIMDLTQYMSVHEFRDNFPDAAILQVTYQGRIWGVPVANVYAGTSGYGFYHVSASSRNPVKAFELLTFLMDN